MTNIEKIRAEIIDTFLWEGQTEEELNSSVRKCLEIIDKYTEQEPSRDMEEIAEIMKCDADAETKCKMISNILTAKPHYFAEKEPKTGKWEKIVKEHKCFARDDTYTTTEYHCSECGTEPLAEFANDESDIVLSNFCPNCGAKMESEVNND